MQKSFAIIILKIFFIMAIIIPLYAQDPSLVGFWTFDDSTGVDSSLYGNDGILNGNPMIISGMKGSAIYFDGIDDEVFVWDSNSLDTDSSMTISLWIMPDSVNPGGAKPMSKWYSAPQQGDWILSLSSIDSCNGTCVSYYFGFANYSVYGTTNGWFSIGPHDIDYYLKLGEWNFIAVTFDTGFVNLYYNGDLIYTDTTIIKYTSLGEYGTDDIHIGRYHSGYSGYSFKGGLDEIRIYNRPLSSGEINDIYNQVTSVENNLNRIPRQFELTQNYPNPFNPSTKILYSIPEPSDVVIKVFDILGNDIETLVDEEKTAGTYEITWYADNLPSGIYFYQLQVYPASSGTGDPSTGSLTGQAGQSFIETKKSALLK
jgi:hypothetical protein